MTSIIKQCFTKGIHQVISRLNRLKKVAKYKVYRISAHMTVIVYILYANFMHVNVFICFIYCLHIICAGMFDKSYWEFSTAFCSFDRLEGLPS
ncbi:uncharacterized protein ASCRUDRAFT_123184 [Ascoidea rubescens DSM 1968]|uniref:Uncharacterized protein n=1 Tax=Ascoidea rubescens DSM 1968 TaxID=1344418 RepID=A0A1D2VME7_9ASCO|nr:hypothetical protein ASCRUDRAFT_123184 [Ascoidea rubescens DSM 1968]ODV62725.1 hypothetical protein ASCRUDRAFT_123184 [Ascoidea rubescens DSM 1968]